MGLEVYSLDNPTLHMAEVTSFALASSYSTKNVPDIPFSTPLQLKFYSTALFGAI